MPSAIPTGYTSFLVPAGITTAFSAPASTALVVNYWSLCRSGTGVGNVTAVVRFGNTANLAQIYPTTALGPKKMIQGGGALTLNASTDAFLISASSGSGMYFFAAGLIYA